MLLGVGFPLFWQIVRSTSAAGWWPFQLLAAFDPWLYLLLLPLAAAAMLRRDWPSCVLLVVPVLFFSADYGPLFLPKASPGRGTPVRVMSANVLYINDDPASFRAALLAEEPDVVATQELGTTMADAIAGSLKDRYPYQSLHPARTTAGMGILSRYPFRAGQLPGSGGLPCRCQAAVLDIDGRAVTILNVHLYPSRIAFRSLGPLPIPVGFGVAQHEAELRAIMQYVERSAGPLIVLGDLNLTDHQPLYRRISQRLHDAHREAGWGFGHTFPARRFHRIPLFPLIRIDYVLYDEHWATRAAWTGEVVGSDHRYVAADLILRR